MKINIYEYPEDKSLLPEYRIAVMQAALEGKPIQVRSHVKVPDNRWRDFPFEPNWDWATAEYRIAYDCDYRIANPAPRYFRHKDGLFPAIWKKPDFKDQYCMKYWPGFECRKFTDGRESDHHASIFIDNAVKFAKTGRWVEFDGNMEPFRPKHPADCTYKKSSPTTVMGWLLTLPYEYRVLAIRNMDSEKADDLCANIEFAIANAFVWLHSNEGQDFWNGVYYHYYKGASLPPIPKPKVLVPWTIDTAPKGNVLHRYKNGTKEVGLVVCWEERGVNTGTRFNGMKFELYGNMLFNSEHSLDGGKTWLPCGTEV